LRVWYRRGRRVGVTAVTGPPFPEESIEFEVSEDRILLDAA
jgi:hypothetical protein